MRCPTVLLADDHAILTDGIRLLLEPHYEVVGAVRDGQALAEAAGRLRPDVIIVDVSLPSFDAIKTVQELKRACPQVKIIFLTACLDATMATKAMGAGAAAYVLKTSPSEELVAALREALNGGVFIARQALEHIFALPQRSSLGEAARPGLSARETEVLRLIAEGRRTKEAAYLLNLSPRTVEFHKYRIAEKLGVSSTAELTQYAVRRGVVPA